MNRALTALISRLTFGQRNETENGESLNGFVETLARAYEKARNALEYRADNLVRRAAIERILKRRIVLNKDPESLTQHLLMELKWARYLSIDEVKDVKKKELLKIIQNYLSLLGGVVPTEWIVKIASAEIEELFNLNTDYKQFTFFAFQALKQKIAMKDANLDLLIYFATDKIYAGSDDEQIAYHILKLAEGSVTKENFAEAWRLFNLAKNHKGLSRIAKFVRKQMPPLILLRDIYFYSPNDFKTTVSSENKFMEKAKEVLDNQIDHLTGRIKTAGTRSVIYVFLTKMVLAFGLEVPLEIFFYKHLNGLPLAINLTFPPILMWFATMQIKLPGKQDKEALVTETWKTISDFESLKDEGYVLMDVEEGRSKNTGYWIFSILYSIFFFGVFGLIFFALGEVGYTFFSKVIFIFFLCVIAFFAYRIVQIAKVYSWKKSARESSNLIDIFSLPILSIGSRLSRGLSKLNFLAFTFDFILEAPFKIILGFVDAWVQFLSTKKEEEIIE